MRVPFYPHADSHLVLVLFSIFVNMSRQSYPLIASESDEFSILKDDEVFQHKLCADGFVSGFVGIAVPLVCGSLELG